MGGNGGFFEKFQIGLVVLGVIGALVGASALFLVALALISIAASLIQFFLYTNPCGDFRDNVNLWLNISIAVIGSLVGLKGGVGQSIAAAIAGWVYGSGIGAALESK